MVKYDSYPYRYLFDMEAEEGEGFAEWRKRSRSVLWYRTKTIESGDLLEVEVYPVWNTRRQVGRAREAAPGHLDALRKMNEKYAKDKIVRLVNTNFTESDISLYFTYRNPGQDMERVKRDVQNYIRRARNWHMKHGTGEMKYLYVIEVNAEGNRYHVHMILSGVDREVAEGLWKHGRRSSDRLQPDDFGLTGLSLYLTKAPQGRRRWAGSKNLKKPVEKRRDKHLGQRRVHEVATGFHEVGPGVLEELFKGYRYLDGDVKNSRYVEGTYIRARLRRKEDGENSIFGGKDHRRRRVAGEVSSGGGTGEGDGVRGAVPPHTAGWAGLSNLHGDRRGPTADSTGNGTAVGLADEQGGKL